MLDHKLIDGHRHIRYEQKSYDSAEMMQQSEQYYQWLDSRRSVRDFTDRPVSRSIIENIIKAAGTAPSGAHKQPWTFCAVSNGELKAKIKIAAEKEEKESYEHRMSERWKDDLKPMGTNMYKPFLTIAPWLIIVFKKAFDLDQQGSKSNNYYVNESVGIACGMLISAIHKAGLVTLTHTPSPMNFLAEILERPKNERAYLLLPVGYPADDVFVPDIGRKTLDEMAVFYE